MISFKEIFKKEPWKDKFKRYKVKHPKAGMVEKPNGPEIIFDIVIWLILLLMTFIFIVPFWHVIMASFSRGDYLIAHEGIVWWPLQNAWNVGGYEMLLEYDGILSGYGNTLLYVVAGTLLGLVINVLGGYCMYRKTGLQKFFVIFVMITMLFNGGIIPTYIVVSDLGLLNSHFAVIFLTCTNALYVILTMNAFRGVNQATVEAAELDGAGHLRIMFQVMLPQCMSMMSVVLLFTVVAIWNGWFEAQVYLQDNSAAWPLQLWINQIRNENQNFLMEQNTNWDKYVLTFTVIVVSTVPILIIATVFQKYIEKGVILGGVKE